mgnify:FL=1
MKTKLQFWFCRMNTSKENKQELNQEEEIEMKKKLWKSTICGAAALLLAGFCFPPQTAWAGMGNYNFVSIEGGTVDSITVNGVTVEAKYRPYDSSVNTDTTYSCAAFVKRFYSEVYGRNVSGLLSTTSVPAIDSGSFKETISPKVGDIVRDNESVHWAIVKEVNQNIVTVIQQNAWDSSYTKAWVGAMVENGDSQYTFFTWDGNTASAAPTAGNYTIHYQEPQIQETTAVLSAKVDNPGRVNVSQVGCYLWDAQDNLIKRHVEDCRRPESRFNMWYDVQGELGIALTAGTTYKYQFFVIQDGNEYPGTIQTFTTAGTAPVKTEADTKDQIEGAPVSTEATDHVTVTDDEIQRTIGKVREIYGWEKKYVDESLQGQSYLVQINTKGEVDYFSVDTLMERPASLVLTIENDRVVKSQWIYEYSSGSEAALTASQDLYQQICKAADGKISGEKTSLCKDVDNMTTTYKDKLEIVRDKNGEKPYVSITVLSAFQDIIG